MSDTASRSPVAAPQMLADALLRTVAGTTALLRVTSINSVSAATEVGVVSTTFYNAVLSPVVMRKLRPSWQTSGTPKWEMLVSATSVAQQVDSLQIDSARALFAATLSITVAEQEYLIESVAANEAFGQVYLYRLLLREAQQQTL
jgi:hypothetical protein